jgi:hypothetical protein
MSPPLGQIPPNFPQAAHKPLISCFARFCLLCSLNFPKPQVRRSSPDFASLSAKNFPQAA